MFHALYRIMDDWRRRLRSQRMPPHLALGRRGEDLAHRHLRSQGLTIVARNYRAAFGGEIDIVAWDGDVLAFVEVKARESAEFALPDRNIGPVKQRSLVRAARDYLRRTGEDWEKARFDVVSVVLAHPPAIDHYRDAFYPERWS